MTDSLYHRLFCHPIMVEQLVRDFVPEALAAGLDFSRMERVNAKFHTRRGRRRREGDVIWRLPTEAGPVVYLYLLVEFQSRNDRWMAVRAQVYTGLLWQHLIRELRLKRGDRLPPVLVVVLHNGNKRWTAPTSLAELIALPPGSPLWSWQPQARYYLVDESAFPGSDLARRESLVALLFRLETCHDPAELLGLVDEVIGWFRQHPEYQTLKELFTEIVAQTLAGMGHRAATLSIPDDLLEVRNMLATRAQGWVRQWKAEGRAEGKAEMLLRQLRRRFGDLPADITDCVRGADGDELDDWSDRILDAKSLGDVFGDACATTAQ